MVRIKIRTAFIGLLAAIQFSQGEAAVTSYTFPTTEYPTFGSKYPNDGGMVHGLCVLGAADAKATVKGSGFSYRSVPMKEGIKGWQDSPFLISGIKGNGPEVCEGGTYLRPVKMKGPPPGVDVTLEATPLDESAGVTICAIIEVPFDAANGKHRYDRSGNWEQPLMDDGFTPSEKYLRLDDIIPERFTSYCKHFPPPPPPPPPPTTYTFPTTQYQGGMVHGICVLGAKDVTTTISENNSGFKYTNIPDFKDAVQAFGDTTHWKMSGVTGNGDPVCEGGTYLQPSATYGPPSGVDITLEATAMDTTTGITLCVFVERVLTELNLNRQGNWKDPLIYDGFVAGPHLTYNPSYPTLYTSYCKDFGPTTISPSIGRYAFPRTDYPVARNSNGGMIHGICVLGSKDVTTTISENNSGFKYTNIPYFRDGVQAFGESTYWKMSGVTGNGDPVCEGGTYLQPSAVYGPPSGVDITLEATAMDTMTGITLCVFVEKLFGQYNRQGNWKDPLIADGFVAGLPLSYTPNGSDPTRWTSYCKEIAPAATSLTVFPSQSPSMSPTTTFVPWRGYALPRTDYPARTGSRGGMIHGLCVVGAKEVTTTLSGNVNGFSYKNIPNFRNGVKAFGGGTWKYSGVNGKGDSVCEGGNYLQPSSIYGLGPGVDVTVEATAMDRDTDVSLCVFVERDMGQNRQGNWKDPLIADGFVAGKYLTYAPKDNKRFQSYCKVLEPDLKYMPESYATACPDDVKVKRTYGTTEFPESSITPAVSIVSQETSTVTVALNQAWGATVDKYFYEYSETLFTSKCYEVEGVAPGETIDTITLQCLVTSPRSSLRICLQDTSNSLLSAEDDAVMSKCCQSDAPKDTPTVCYNLDILCETSCGSDKSVARYIRGRY